MKSLVLGYGNPIRCDDAIGIYIAGQIDQKHLEGVDIRIMQQLQLEVLDDLMEYEKVIFVDASSGGLPVSMQKIHPKDSSGLISSHHLKPELFTVLAKKIYDHSLNLYVCTVRGENFDFGESLSPEVLPRVKDATQKIINVLMEES